MRQEFSSCVTRTVTTRNRTSGSPTKFHHHYHRCHPHRVRRRFDSARRERETSGNHDILVSVFALTRGLMEDRACLLRKTLRAKGNSLCADPPPRLFPWFSNHRCSTFTNLILRPFYSLTRTTNSEFFAYLYTRKSKFIRAVFR